MNMQYFKRCITMTYKIFGNAQSAWYWNLGYICALINNEITNERENVVLKKYNDKVYPKKRTKTIKGKIK